MMVSSRKNNHHLVELGHGSLLREPVIYNKYINKKTKGPTETAAPSTEQLMYYCRARPIRKTAAINDLIVRVKVYICKQIKQLNQLNLVMYSGGGDGGPVLEKFLFILLNFYSL